MKKLIIVITTTAFLLFGLSACGGGGSTKLKTAEDSVAYALGLDLGEHLKNMQDRMGTEINLNIIMGAIKDAYKDNAKMEKDAAYAFMNEYFTVRLPIKTLAEGQEFLEKIGKENKNIVKTESGLMYEIIDAGDQNIKASKDEDVVRVTYEGKLKTGVVFDSSFERGDTAEFALNRVIKGWTEGMKLVGKGGKIKLWIPSELGYGEHGGGAKIGPNEPLVFEVTMVDVTIVEVEPIEPVN